MKDPNKIKNALLIFMALALVVTVTIGVQLSSWNAQWEVRYNTDVETQNQEIRKANEMLDELNELLEEAQEGLEMAVENDKKKDLLYETFVDEAYWKGVGEGCLNMMLQSGIMEPIQAVPFCQQWAARQRSLPQGPMLPERPDGGSFDAPTPPKKGLNSA